MKINAGLANTTAYFPISFMTDSFTFLPCSILSHYTLMGCWGILSSKNLLDGQPNLNDKHVLSTYNKGWGKKWNIRNPVFTNKNAPQIIIRYWDGWITLLSLQILLIAVF